MDRTVIARRRATAIAIALAATVLIWMLISGGDGDSNEAGDGPRIGLPSDGARGLLTQLSVEEKIDQLIMAPAKSGPELASDVKAGWITVGSDAWPGVDTGKDFTRRLRKLASQGSIEPLILTRQEGGPYREMFDLPPAARAIAIGDRAKPELAAEWATETANALRKAGFDMNIAPIADIATLDSPISDRAFSDDPATVDAMTVASVQACRTARLVCIPAHFPGLGAATDDTDLGPASISLDRDTLLSRDAAVFGSAFDAGAPAVVVSNAFYAAYDPVTPASLSPDILSGLLRERLGFEGVAITDDLSSGAIRSGYRTAEAAVLAIAGGADVVQVSDPGSVDSVKAALIEAAEDGTIRGNRLDEAAGRVIDLKRGLGRLG